MKDSFEYFKESNRCFIDEFQLLELYQQIETGFIANLEATCNDEELEQLNEAVMPLIQQFCNIFYNTEIADDLLNKYEEAKQGLNDFFCFDDTLKKYLGISEQTTEDIKPDFADGFHQYLYFYSHLQLPEDIKARLNLKNIRILKKVEEKDRALQLLNSFDNSLYSATVQLSGITETVRDHRLSLLKQAGIMPEDTKYASLDTVLRSEIAKRKQLTEEEKEKEELQHKQSVAQFYNYIYEG